VAATYELWDVDSGNVIGAYPSEKRALAAVASAVGRYGLSYADSLALIREDSRGSSKLLLSGAALSERAQQTTSDDITPSDSSPQPASA
jgi:hypothetical protein